MMIAKSENKWDNEAVGQRKKYAAQTSVVLWMDRMEIFCENVRKPNCRIPIRGIAGGCG